MTPTQNDESRVAEDSTPARKEATGRPWRYGRTGPEQRMILGSNERYVCSVQIYQTPRAFGLCDETEREANAALIVEAVNILPEHERRIEELTRHIGVLASLLEGCAAYDDKIGHHEDAEFLRERAAAARAALKGTKAQ